MLEFKRTGDADYPRHLNTVLMGPPKSGKTTFISTAPNVVVGAAEAGLMSIAHKNVPYIDIKGSDTLQQLIMVLGNDTLRAKLAEQLGMEKIETFALDTTDAFQEILKKERLRAERRTQMQRDDWGWLKDNLTEMIKALVACPINVILTVHTKTTQDDESRIITMPGLQGAIAEDLAGLVDFSMLAQRSREVKPDGTPYMRYYLQVEGDNKNPHLGNRGAGRLPMEVDPDFVTLHKAVFDGITTNPTAQPVIQVGNTSDQVEVAQSSGQAQAAAAPAQPTTTAPPSDDDQPVNATALQVLAKFYDEFGWKLNEESYKAINLGDARLIARMFKAQKEDLANGKQTQEKATSEMLELLRSMGVPPVGDVAPTTPDVQTDVPTETPAAEASASAETAPETPSETLPSGDTPADTTQTQEQPTTQADAPVTEEEALKTLEDKVGATVIGIKHDPDAPCEECGGAIDDQDIAELSFNRYKRRLCVKDYIAATKTA